MQADKKGAKALGFPFFFPSGSHGFLILSLELFANLKHIFRMLKIHVENTHNHRIESEKTLVTVLCFSFTASVISLTTSLSDFSSALD